MRKLLFAIEVTGRSTKYISDKIMTNCVGEYQRNNRLAPMIRFSASFRFFYCLLDSCKNNAVDSCTMPPCGQISNITAPSFLRSQR